jgi:hypothetical protein
VMLKVRALPLEPFNKVVGGQRLLAGEGEKKAKVCSETCSNRRPEQQPRIIQRESGYNRPTAH